MKERIPCKENPIFAFWRLLWAFCFSSGMLAVVVAFLSLNTGFEGMTPPAIYMVLAAATAVVLPLYTLPAFFAYRKQMEKRKKVLLVNLLLGWTVVGYVLCIVWVDKTAVGG